MKKIAAISVILFIILLSFPLSRGLELISDDRLKYGDYGQEIRYYLEVRNNENNPKDIYASIGDHSWNASITVDEFLNVPANENVTFEVIVEIPHETDLLTSETQIHFFDRDHVPILSEHSDEGYTHRISEKLYTEIIEKHVNPSSPKEAVMNNPVITIILVALILLPGYVWHGRKYFFFEPLYMKIPKEKLLDHEKREKISHYLSMYNGSNLTEISQGTGINIQTLRHHMRLFEQSNFVIQKEKQFFIKNAESEVFDTAILSPALQRVLTIIKNVDGITVLDLVSTTKRSKPWIGNRIHELLLLDLIEIQKVGRFKHIYPKGFVPNSDDPKSQEDYHPMKG